MATGSEPIATTSTDTDGVSVKLESGIGASASASASARPRGLIAVLPHHLSAVNVVRWEPVLGTRLASGSDLPTQSIIIWKREEAKDANNRKNGAIGGGGGGATNDNNSSMPFGLGRNISSEMPSMKGPGGGTGTGHQY